MAVPAVTGLALWDAHLRSQSQQEHAHRTQKLATGHAGIDATLVGGLSYGSLSCLSSSPNTGDEAIIHSLITTHLLTQSTAKVFIFDSGGTFDVLKLSACLSLRLASNRDIERARLDGLGLPDTTSDANVDLQQYLDRVSIARIFDFTGLLLSIRQTHDVLEHRGEISNPNPHPSTIVDSDSESEEGGEDLTSSLLIIDNFSSLTTAMIKKSPIEGQAHATSFLRSLSRLKEEFHLCVLLVDNLVPTPPIRDGERGTNMSCFASNASLQPSLLPTLVPWVEVHMFLTRQPRDVDDAKALYDGRGQGTRRVKHVNVLEVVRDKYSDRVGRWTGFVVTGADGVEIVDTP